MDFGKAIEALKAGKKITRAGWNGKGMYLWLKQGITITADMCHDPTLKELATENGGEIVGLPTICAFTRDSCGYKAVQTGWLASQSDILLDDWEVVNE